MDDFSTPGLLNAYGVYPSESNMIYPGKRPQSSTAPSIFLDGDGVARLVIGASGGTKITTAISLVRWRQFFLYDNQKKKVVIKGSILLDKRRETRKIYDHILKCINVFSRDKK